MNHFWSNSVCFLFGLHHVPFSVLSGSSTHWSPLFLTTLASSFYFLFWDCLSVFSLGRPAPLLLTTLALVFLFSLLRRAPLLLTMWSVSFWFLLGVFVSRLVSPLLLTICFCVSVFSFGLTRSPLLLSHANNEGAPL
jgi:hypothetical protein